MLLFACIGQAFAANAPPIAQGNIADEVGVLTSTEFVTTICLLLFGIFVILIQFWIVKARPKEDLESFYRYLIITVIIVGTLVLISTGLSGEQIAPAAGLFGTLAGYLLSRRKRRERTNGDRGGKGDGQVQ
jgi:glycerol uptake facilitator-like aquaporin